MTASPALRRINSGRGHRYTIDGAKVTGVTTLIKGGRPNPALINWAAREVGQYVADNFDDVQELILEGRDAVINTLRNIPNKVRNTAALKGTQLHAMAERLVDGDEVEVAPEIADMVRGYINFLDEWKVQPILVESVVGNRTYAYGGTTDLVADVITPHAITTEQAPWLEYDIPAGTKLRVIMDPKTSRSGVFPDAAYQLAAYWHAEVYLGADGTEKPMADLGIEFAAVLHVTADETVFVPMNAGPETFKTFTYLATVTRRIADDRALVGSAVVRPDIEF